MPGWVTYNEKRAKKSNAAEPLTRHELAKKFPGTQDELIELAARCKMKPKKIPYAPHLDEMVSDPEPAFVGPCQVHVAHLKARRAAGKPVVAEKDDEPCADERQRKLLTARAYHKARYVKKKAKK